jgi:hypothetical protein
MDVFQIARRPLTKVDGLEGRLIDRDRNGASLLLELSPGTRLDHPGLEVLVLEGAAEAGESRLGPLDFALLGAPATIRAPTRAIAWVPAGDRLGEPRVQAAAGAEWRQPALGSTAGMLFRPLRSEERVDRLSSKRVTGSPRGFRRLTVLAPGWSERRCEIHAECREENILLAGDLWVAGEGRGLMRPGSVLVNESGLRHGPMATRGGAVLLISCDGWMSVEWSAAPEAEVATLDRYLAAGPGWPASA